MPEQLYKFEYRGIVPEIAVEPARRTEGGLVVIDLYRVRRDPFWWVVIDFPPPLQQMEPTRYCSSFLDLVQIMEESNALERFETGQRKDGDDLLMFARSLRETGEQEPDICPTERVLTYKRWDYDIMKVLMESRNPLPSYDCPECGQFDLAADYSSMIAHAISYIGTRAARYINENLDYTMHLRRFFPEDLDKMFQ